MNRRQFIRTTTLATTAMTALRSSALGASESDRGVHWDIGCFNRPWVNDQAGWTEDTALDGIRDAGYKITGLLTRTKKDPFMGAEATAEYLDALKEKIAARGLRANMGSVHTRPKAPFEALKNDVRKQIDNAKRLDLEFLLTFGVDDPADYENYCLTMSDAADYAQERGLKLVLKPHGGSSGEADKIIECLEKVKRPNFKIWYDAGNIIYYNADKDPVEQLKPIVQYVTGFCAKDCDKEHGEVFLQFGTGKVNFAAVFAELKRGGFNGPVMVECCAKGKTAEETTVNTRKNREFLERAFGGL